MYALLHYRGDRTELAKGLTVTRSDGGAERTVPVLLGEDPAGLPYEVLDVEYEPCAECDPTVGYPGPVWQDAPDVDRAACPSCGGTGGRSTVHLGPASPDTVRGNRSAAYHQREQNLDELVAHARARHYWRPDVWAAPAADQTIADAAA